MSLNIRLSQDATGESQAAGPIAMVDDNEGDLWLASYCLRASKVSAPLITFPSGIEFMAHLQAVKRGEHPIPRLVLLDVNMPGLSGLDVLERTRADAHFNDLPIFCMLTSSTDSRDKAAALQRGASGFVTKPGTMDAYIAFFDSLIARPAGRD